MKNVDIERKVHAICNLLQKNTQKQKLIEKIHFFIANMEKEGIM